MTISTIKTFAGQCGRRAAVCRDNELRSYFVEKRSVNGMLKMWEVEDFHFSDYPNKEAALDAAKETAEAFVNERPTNTERVMYLMNYSNAGPLIQAFVIQGIEHYADAVINAGADKVNTGLVNGAAWVRCAEDAKRQLGE